MKCPAFKEFGWDCKGGENCFNVKRRPKFGVFFDCFKGSNSLTDIDGFNEQRGHFLFVEFKADGLQLGDGQRKAFEQLSYLSDKILILVIHADCETMECFRYKQLWRGEWSAERDGTLADVQALMSQWDAHVNRDWCPPHFKGETD